MKIPYMLTVSCISAILSDKGYVLSKSGTDDCCEKYDERENIFKVVYGIQGSDVNFTCPYSRSTDRVSWVGPPNHLTIIAINGMFHRKLNSKYEWIDDNKASILQIRNVTKVDEGSYRCQVFNDSDIFCFCLSKLPTSIKIENLTQNNELIGIPNNDLTMTCTVEGGRPKATLVLANSSGDTLISGDLQSLNYFFTPKIIDDGKQFVCKAYHSPFYSTNISVTLRIFSIPVVHITPVTNIVQEGDSVLRKCHSYSNDALTHYKWYRLTQTVTQTVSKTNTLSIRNVNRDEAGTYICEASNRAGGNKSEIDIVVQYAPDVSVSRTIRTKSNDIMLACHAVGIPNNFTFFRWEHKTHTGQHLRFLKAGETLLIPTGKQDTHYYINGIYFCNVSNGVPNMNGHVFQRAQYQLYYGGIPTFMTTNDNIQYGHYQQLSTITIRLWSYPNVKKIQIGYAGLFYDLPTKKIHLNMQKKTMQDEIYGKTVNINGYEIKIIFIVENENQFTRYTVRVYNEKGYSRRSIDFKPGNRPETPSNLTVIIEDKIIKVLWNRNFDGGYPQFFIIQYRPINSLNWTESQRFRDNQSARQEAFLFNLLPGTLYDFRIFARNSVNDSDLSEIVRVKTTPDIDPSTVQNGPANGGILKRELIIYSAASALILMIIGLGICFLKCRRHPGENVTTNSQSRTDYVRRQQHDWYDEIDETILVDSDHGRNEGSNLPRPRPETESDASGYLQPIHEEEPSESDKVIVDRFGYLILPPNQPSETAELASEGYDFNLSNNQNSDDTFAKEVCTHHSYQKLKHLWQRSIHSYTTSLNTTDTTSKMMQKSNYDDYTDAKSRPSRDS